MSRICLVFEYEINTRHIRDEYEANTRYGEGTAEAGLGECGLEGIWGKVGMGRNRSRARGGGVRRDGVSEGEDPEFDAAVMGTAFFGVVGVDGDGFAEAFGLDALFADAFGNQIVGKFIHDVTV